MAVARGNKKITKLKCLDMEIALSAHFNPRQNLIVPNVSWGLNIHECDLLILSKAGYATEVEIKVSLSDLKRDLKKKHCHVDKADRIKSFYFAIPDYLEKEGTPHIPERAGIIIVMQNRICRVVRMPKISNNAKPFRDEERFKLAHLAAMRIWTLKKRLKKVIESDAK